MNISQRQRFLLTISEVINYIINYQLITLSLHLCFQNLIKTQNKEPPTSLPPPTLPLKPPKPLRKLRIQLLARALRLIRTPQFLFRAHDRVG